MDINPASLQHQRDDCIRFHDSECPAATLNFLSEMYSPWERMTHSAEALYAVRAELSEPWREYLISLLQFSIIMAFNYEVDGRDRAPSLLAEVITPSVNPPQPWGRFVTVSPDPED